MAGIELVREQRIQFGTNGAKVAVDEYYIKLRVGFEKVLFELQESSRCFFLEVAIHEAKIELLGALPLNIYEVAEITHLSVRACKYAAADLLARNLIVKVGTRPDRSHMYRPCDYAWFGADRVPPPSALSANGRSVQNLHTQKTPKRVTKAKARAALSVQADAPTVQPVAQMNSPSVQTRAMSVQKNAPRHDDDVLDSLSSEKLKHHDMEAVEKILARVFDGVNVQRLARKVKTVERATEWVDWIEHATTRKKFRNPQGAAYAALMEDENARPPFVPSPETKAARKRGTGIRLSLAMQKRLNQNADGTPRDGGEADEEMSTEETASTA